MEKLTVYILKERFSGGCYMVEIKPYSNEYRKQVIACLIRNYANLARMGEEALDKWFDPLTSYSWQEDISLDECPYKYGIILLRNGEVVGYCGMIFSYMYVEGIRRLYMVPSTLAIDEKYRMYLFKMLRVMVGLADISCDFTPRLSMRKVFKDVFRYKYIDDHAYLFYPEPSWDRDLCDVKLISDENDIKPEDVRIKYIDHKPYDVECVSYNLKGKKDKEYFFFYRIPVKPDSKGVAREPWIQVLSITDSFLFTEHIEEIAYKIFELTGCKMMSDSRFLEEDKLQKGKYIIKERHRLLLSKDENVKTVDLMYSEMPLMKL